MLKNGDIAPNFTLLGEDGKQHCLSNYHGRHVVLYFYPKDGSPISRKNPNNFFETLARYDLDEYVLCGVSEHSLEDCQTLHKQHGLDYHLLSDTSLEVHHIYDAWRDGHTLRSVFIIGTNGVIEHIWSENTIERHHADLQEWYEEPGHF